MEAILLISFICLLIFGVMIVPLSLPGSFVLFLDALLYSIFVGFPGSKTWVVLLISGMLVALGEGIEFFTTTVGPKKEAVPGGAIAASIIGGIIGAIIGIPIILIGSVLGLFVGTFLGAFLYSVATHKKTREAMRIATITLCSRMVAIFAKTMVALVMAVYLLIKVF